MRTSIPISFILIPTICSLGLLLYSVLSDRWVQTDFDKIEHIDKNDIPTGLVVRLRRMAFLKRLGLFRKCVEYHWLNVVDLNTTRNDLQKKISCSRACKMGEFRCGACCIPEKLRCDHIPECEKLEDELNCPRLFHDQVWLDNELKCFKHKINVVDLSCRKKINNFGEFRTKDYYSSDSITGNNLLHGIMVWLLVSATSIQLLIIISLVLVKVCQKHLSFPFTLLTFLCVVGFLCGIAAIGIFLWNWVHRKIHMTSFHQYGEDASILLDDAVTYRLNPWVTSIEILDIAFYITCAGVLLCLVTSIISLLFFCGVTGSRLSFEKGKGSYEIVKILPYEDHYVKS